MHLFPQPEEGGAASPGTASGRGRASHPMGRVAAWLGGGCPPSTIADAWPPGWGGPKGQCGHQVGAVPPPQCHRGSAAGGEGWCLWRTHRHGKGEGVQKGRAAARKRAGSNEATRPPGEGKLPVQARSRDMAVRGGRSEGTEQPPGGGGAATPAPKRYTRAQEEGGGGRTPCRGAGLPRSHDSCRLSTHPLRHLPAPRNCAQNMSTHPI